MPSHLVLLLLAAPSVLSIQANGSEFPPLINSKNVNVSIVEHAVLAGTNTNDVKGLAALQSRFIVLRVNFGDPCLAVIPWFWIVCNTDPTPRVIELNLRGNALAGPLPDFSSMDALEKNLANNDFRRTVPASLLEKSKDDELAQDVTGNSNLCGEEKSCKKTDAILPPSYGTPETYSTPEAYNTPETYGTPTRSSSKRKSNKLRIIIGRIISIIGLVWIILGVVARWHHRHKSATAVAAISSNQGDYTQQGAAINPHVKDQKDEVAPNKQVTVDLSQQ